MEVKTLPDSLQDHTPAIHRGWQQLFFTTKPLRTQRINTIWLVCLSLTGVFLLGNFLNWGNIPLDFHDWSDITAPRFTFQKDALEQGEWPLHISYKSTVGGVTDRFLSIPDVIVSPQILLLKFLDVGSFSMENILLLYSFGFLGLIFIQHKYFLSSVSFTIAFILFNFNGHILAHLSVGHVTWGGYFLFPFFVLLIFDFIEGSRSWKWVAQMAGLLFIILIQGSYHQFVWCLFFLGILAIIRPIKNWPALAASVFAVLLSMIRIWPCSLAANEFESKFHGGYGGLLDIWNSMTRIQLPGLYFESPSFVKPLGMWEITLFIGFGGTFFVLLFGIVRWMQDRQKGFHYFELIIPISGLMILSISPVFEWLRQIPFPLLTGERVSSRIIILPLVFFILLAVIKLQDYLEKQEKISLFKALIFLVFIVGVCVELWGNYQVWSVSSIYQAFPHEVFNEVSWFVANRYDDWRYIQAIQRGTITSLVGLVLLIAFVYIEKRRMKLS